MVIKRYRHLQHVDLLEHYQFITFRTQDSVDNFLQRLGQCDLSSSKKQFAMDRYLDQSINGAYLKGDVLLILYNYLKQKEGDLYDLEAFCIMPNHVHLLIKPLHKLSKVMQCIKGGSAKLINQQLDQKGVFWFADYYDKLVCDEVHFKLVYEYIRNNLSGLTEPEVMTTRFYGRYG
jgi:REP element-mobilizing transposase RayT